MIISTQMSLLLVFQLPIMTRAVVNEDLSCLRNFRVQHSSSTELNLTWDYECDSDLSLLFKIYFEHMEWRACPHGQQDENRGRGRGNTETTSKSIVLSNLHPFSVYRVSVKALMNQRRPEEKYRVAETRQGLPMVSPIPLKVEEKRDELTFTWQEPDLNDCNQFNANLKGVVYTLRGVDEWNKHEERSGTTTENHVKISDLKSFSRYKLYLHSRTIEEGLFNPDKYTIMRARTKSAGPGAPGAPIRLYSDGLSMMLEWQLPFPPTGELERFELRWRQENNTRWSNKEEINIQDNLCKHNEKRDNEFNTKMSNRFCYRVLGLQEGWSYTFQVAAYNKNISLRSPWSSSSTLQCTTPASTSGRTASSSLLIILVVLIVVSILFVAALTAIFVVRRRQGTRGEGGSSGQNKKYNSLPVYETGGSVATRSTIVETNSGSGSVALRPLENRWSRRSIQDLPLPEPPDSHLYEELPNKVEEVYLPPINVETRDSNNTLDVDEYLKPTFNHFEHIDTRELSPPHKSPPPIPVVSYKQSSIEN